MAVEEVAAVAATVVVVRRLGDLVGARGRAVLVRGDLMMRALTRDLLRVLGAVELLVMLAAVDLVARDALRRARRALDFEQLFVAIELLRGDGPHLPLVDMTHRRAGKKHDEHGSQPRAAIPSMGRQSDQMA